MPANRKDSIKYASNPFLEEASQLSITKHKPILTKQDKNGRFDTIQNVVDNEVSQLAQV